MLFATSHAAGAAVAAAGWLTGCNHGRRHGHHCHLRAGSSKTCWEHVCKHLLEVLEQLTSPHLCASAALPSSAAGAGAGASSWKEGRGEEGWWRGGKEGRARHLGVLELAAGRIKGGGGRQEVEGRAWRL